MVRQRHIMKKTLSKAEFKELLFTVFNIYSHFSDKMVLSKGIDSLDEGLFQQLIEKQDLNRLFYELNKHISEKEVLSKLSQVESYSNIMELALAGIENSSDAQSDADDLKVLNKHLNDTQISNFFLY